MTRFQRLVVLLVGVVSSQAWAAGPVITIGKATGHAGTVVDLPVDFNAGNASVSGIQFNLKLPDFATIGTVVNSDSLNAAGKSVSFHQSGKDWTLIVFGLNQNTNKSGPLLVAKLKIAPTAKVGATKVPISNVVCTDPSGKTIQPGSSKGGTLTIN